MMPVWMADVFTKAKRSEVTRVLRKKGWQVIRIWEHELSKPERVLARFSRWFLV